MKYIFLVIFILCLSILFIYYTQYFLPMNVYENFLSKEKSKKINIDSIKEFTKLNSLYRPVPSNNLEKVKINAIELLNKIPNFIARKQYFTRKIHNKEYSFSNIIANSKNFNKNNPYIILSAHIDGPVNQIGCPASIDAITSVGIIIELAKQIMTTFTNYNLQIVFFDGEEAIDGLWNEDNTLSGSKFFVKNLDSLPSQVFVFDLIGGDIIKNKLYAYSLNPKSHELMSKLAWTNNDLYSENNRIFVDPNSTISYAIIKDDSLPFYNANIPVIDLIPPIFPSTHHSIEDNYENVNWKYIEIFINVIYDYLVKNPVFY
jgi:hypothetical protein